MAELSQRQQDRISKSSSDRLRSRLVRSDVEEDEVAQMDTGKLKAVAARIEVGKQGGEDAKQKPVPDDGEELFGSLEVAVPKSQEYEILKMKLQLRELEIEAETRKAEAETRKIEAERETRKMELEMELKMIELKARTQGGDDESGTGGLEGTAAVAVDNSLAGGTKKFGLVMP